MTRFERDICQARVNSHEFGWGPCFNYAKQERFGLHVCNVHSKMVDRLALGHGEEYAISVVWHEWHRKQAALPRLSQQDAAQAAATKQELLEAVADDSGERDD